MKPTGYWSCYSKIIDALLDIPHWYEPFTEYFDVEKLDAIRGTYGADLYKKCHADAQKAAAKMWNVLVHLMAYSVTCKPIFAQDDRHVDFVAVFDVGDLTKSRINEIIKSHNTYCIFQARS